MEDLGTYDLFNACPGNPWLPLRPPDDQHSGHMSGGPQRPPIEIPQRWFNKRSVDLQPSSRPFTSQTTLMPGREDEISRDALAGSLRKQLPDVTLPSTGFLNRCIRMFCTQLWHIIPIVHLPTFRPAQTNPLLLLSICSLSALAEGSPDALYHAERLLTAINKAILISSQPSEVVSIEQTLPILQAAAIGQTYALLSGKTTDLMLSQLYHGPLGFGVLASEKLMLHSRATELSMSPGLDPEQDWSKWIQLQTVIRLRNAIQIHNGEISAILHAPSTFRSDSLKLQTAAPDALYLAKTPAEWTAASSRNVPVSLLVPFSLCAVIEAFIAEAGQARATPFAEVSLQMTQALLAMLCTWFDDSIQLLTADSANKLSVLMLCHSCFIHMLCDMDLFERACGREGAQAASTQDKQTVKEWASTADARRAASHALCIQLLLERFRLSDVPGMHVARSSWHAGLLLAVYSSYAPVTANAQSWKLEDTFSEFNSVRKAKCYTEQEWTSATCDITPERCSAASFAMAAVLRRLGPWHNAATYADTLGHVIDLLERD
ncbi:hypothetical protein CB0940_08953 [Cercospora beticola]|uniref:Xylanolytic transcriptional activator regulatory domain-containing protein n=1 Tax=Cercospora beticola TaxID=122368 RepID=A0A2G5HPJ0_CERBT|nr:hypothetical protein CB0940_08953 [Cercospora beticola]PIA94428.1 hypothetical protein CB0940_08953 [Cercospora beticola]WPB05551.1 hypothetical protein RHO25_010204 [Cercospora beticola]